MSLLLTKAGGSVNEYGLYEVTGKAEYRGHKHGEQFEARLERNAERRAVARGSIQLLRRITPALEPGSYRIHEAWLSQSSTQSTAPEGAFFMPKGGK